MIEILEGTHETINYGNPLGLRLFHNVDYEDYPGTGILQLKSLCRFMKDIT